jgi:hypothetical protein
MRNVSFGFMDGFIVMKGIFFVFFTIALLPPVFGSSLEELIGADRANALRSTRVPIDLLQQKNPRPQLLPRHEGLERLVADVQKSLDPSMMVETLALYRKPSAAEWSTAEQTGLFNQLTALSTLAGIEYYSASRQTMRVFYETSQVIDDPSGKKPLPDPLYDTLPASLELHARQKDLTFGDNIYRYNYHTGADILFFVQENLTSMNAGIIRAVGKNKFRSMVAVIDAGDVLLIYAAAMAKAASIPGMGDRIGASFTNRINAVLQWFTVRANKVFLKE